MLSIEIRRLSIRAASLTALAAASFGAASFWVAGQETGRILIEPEPLGPEFGYEGDIAPEFWGDLDPSWRLCSEGQSQSPIDIATVDTDIVSLPDLVFQYGITPLSVRNTGHSFEVNYEGGNYMMIGGTRWDALQFHFHTTSEHTFEGGAHFEAELHAVHRNSAGHLAVVAIMITRGEANDALPEAFQFQQVLPGSRETTYDFDNLTINLQDLLPDDLRYYTYRGSLTAPPCSQQVTWFVIPDSIELSKQQLRVLTRSLGNLNFASLEGTVNRPTQPLNGRRIYFDQD